MTDFVAQTYSTPDQLDWAGRLDLPPLPPPQSVVVAGMGGSGIAGDFAAVLAEREGRRVEVVKGYRLPRSLERPLVVAISYSGNTEETLAVAAEAGERGLDVVGISSGGSLADLPLRLHVAVPGGNQPRASLGYLLGALCRVLAAASFISEPDLAEASAAVSKALEGEETRAREMAERIFGRVPIIWGGSPLTGAVAQRWKTQMNENAKSPAWWSMLPEADHNEIVGWSGALSRHFVVVPLVDGDDHPRIARRLAATRRLTDPRLEWLEPVSAGEGAPLSRMLRLAAVADLVTLELARRYRVDPGSVAVIDELKQLLEES